MMPSPELRARLLEQIKREPAPTVATMTRVRIASFAAGFLTLGVVFEILGGVVMGERPMGYVALLGVGWAVLALAATWGAVARGRSMLGRPAAWLWVIAIATPIVLFAIAHLGAMLWPATMDVPCKPMNHVSCFAFGSLMGVGPLGAFAFARRHSDPLHPRLTGAAIGVAAGAWGALAIDLHCCISTPLHVLLGHVLPVAFFGILGVLIGAKGVAIRGETK